MLEAVPSFLPLTQSFAEGAKHDLSVAEYIRTHRGVFNEEYIALQLSALSNLMVAAFFFIPDLIVATPTVTTIKLATRKRTNETGPVKHRGMEN